MQKSYHMTCLCGHVYLFPAERLGTDEQERAGLLKALERISCPDCIQADVDRNARNPETNIPHETATSPRHPKAKCPIAEELRRILDNETNVWMQT